MIEPNDRRPRLTETPIETGWTDEELRPKAGDVSPLPHEAPPFDARDAVDVTIWMKIRHLLGKTMFDGVKDLKSTILGALTAILSLLALFGIDPGMSDATMETIATVGGIVAGVVLIFIKPKKKTEPGA